MRIDTGQHLRMDQRMKLAPRMIQSMEILQLPAAALEERIEQELASNPTLELREAGDDADDIRDERKQDERDDSEGERELVVKEESATEHNADDFERLNNMAEEYGDSWESNNFESYRVRRDDGERDGKMDAMANTAARPLSLADQILDQWRLVETTAEIRNAGEYLISFIDDDGYLRTSRDKLIEQAPRSVDPKLLDEALECLQLCVEPVGIGARDVRECLLLQIDAAERSNENGKDYKLVRTLVSDHLKDIEGNRYPKIAKAMEVDIEDVKKSVINLRQFHIHPGRMLVSDVPRRVSPDVIVEFDEDEDVYTVRLTRGNLPEVQISPRYMKMVKEDGLLKKDKDFINNHLRSARWLLEAIEQRNNTLLRVSSVVVEAQREFFEQGEQALKPLPMTTVADQLGIHVATVSRAVSEKYVETPRGIFPLRMFFSGGTETEGGEAMSWAAVQAKLQKIIDAEDKASPLSDDALVEELKKAGIEIARRTVAKYRKQLNIPTARQRKEY